MVGAVDDARAAFARQAWGQAYELLSAHPALEAEDIQRLSIAAYLVGRGDECERALERAHLAWLDAGHPEAAAYCGFWLGLILLLEGEEARAGGWLARSERVLEGAEPDCAARGFLLLPVFFAHLGSGDAAEATRVCDEMVAIGRRCGDKDLVALGVLGAGQSALAGGDHDHGMRLLDEVMVSVTTGEVSPIPSGIVFCAVLEACMDAFDLRRAHAWTDAFQAWCAAQADLVPYRGQCLVHRSEILQAHGGWTEASVEAERARQALSDPVHPALGLALYQQGELHRLRGEVAEAEAAYRAAHQHGREPLPGLALLRLAEGKLDAAVAAVPRLLDERRGAFALPRLLAAACEILLAGGDVDGARQAGDELGRLADGGASPVLQAMAGYARGTVLLEVGEPQRALHELRLALALWTSADMAYDAARTRVAIARACQEVGDADATELELAAATAAFSALGAEPDLARTNALRGSSGRPAALTERECDVLRSVAAGRTNREIGAELSISEHTVARHVQNIFAKIGVASRTAATAYAYEQGLV